MLPFVVTLVMHTQNDGIH